MLLTSLCGLSPLVKGGRGLSALNINMDNRSRGFRAAAAVVMLVFLLAVSAFAMAEADPIRVSSLSEPQSVISEQDVSITIKVYNSSQTDMTEEITLYDPTGAPVSTYNGLQGEQSVTYTGTWHVTQDQIKEGKIKYYIQYNFDAGNGADKVVRAVPVTIQTEAAAPQLTAAYTVTPTSARKGQKVDVEYTLSNTGNIELRSIVISNEGLSDKKLTAPSLSVGEKVTLQDSFTMGDSELVSQPTVTYQASGESKTYTISDMARKTITLAQDGLEAALTTDAGDNVYPGEKIHLTLTLKNTGNNGYTGLTATLEDGTVLASGVELASGASFEQTVEWTPTQSGTLTATVSGTSDNGEAISVLSDELAITTQDASQALVLDVTAQAQTNTIYSEPAVVRFAVQVKNIGQTDAATLTVKEAGTTVATIPSLPSGESRTLVFDLETSIAGQIQFEVSGKDAAGNDKAYDSNVIQLTYIEPTPEPTATPAPTAVPPTPTPEPTATPVPTIGEIIAQHVNPVVLYTIAGVLAALIVALVAVSSVSGAKRKKRMEQAIDTIELSPDVRDSFGKRRRRAQNAGDVKPEKKREKTPEEKTAEAQIVPTPEFKPDEFIASGKNEQKSEQKQEGEETHRRRAPQDVPTDKTLRVAPVEERPEFVPQGKVDDSKTRIFGKLDVENAVNEEQKKAEEAPKAEQKSEAGQETIRLTGEEVQKLKAQVREDHFGMKGKKRDEIKPMKKKKGLFGLGHKKDDDDLLIDDEVDEDDDDDLFE